MGRFASLWMAYAVLLACSLANAAQPRIFFSDLESGSNTGGENNAGAYVTIYGKWFGAPRGDSFVTVGGGRAARYPIWTDTRITLQLGPAAATGDIVVTTPAGASSAIPFTVRAGKIYFVATNGSDSNSGSFASPWRTLLKARDSIAPGDIVYAMNGVSQTTDDDQGWAAAFTLRPAWCGGNLPRALVAYPGAAVTIGNVSNPTHAIRGVDSSAGGGACTGSWVFAGLVLRGQTALNIWGPSSNWRFVGNDLSCPNGDGAAACFVIALASNVKFLGNNLHNSGKVGASALFHGVYLGTDSNNVEIGWNSISEIRGCRGIQVYSHPLGSSNPDTGRNQYGISIHDNLIHDTQCDGIVLYTMDPSRGKVEVYNNVIYNAGLANTPERTGNWSCIMAPGATNYGSPGGGVIDVFNNTLYNCGANPDPPYRDAVNAIGYVGSNPDLKVRIRNNIIYQPSGVPYLTMQGSTNGIEGTNNLFFGNGAAPSISSISKSLNADPLFAGLAAHEFHLSARSPGRRAGVETSATTDKDGAPRGGAAGWDLGAFQYAAPAIASVACIPPAILTPGGASCEITLTEEASESGLELALSIDDPAVTVPERAVVPAGASRIAVHVEAPAVGNRAPARITADLGGSSRSFDLWLLPNTFPALLAAVHAASFLGGPVAPGGMVAIFGLNLGPEAPVTASLTGDRFATVLAGAAMYFDDTPAPLLAVQANQVNAVVPYSVADKRDVRVEIDVGGRRSNPLPVVVAPTAPGVFTISYSGQGQAVVVNEDGTLNSGANPARRGSVITFYAAGLGQTEPPGVDGLPIADPLPQPTAPVSVQMDGLDADLLYAGGAPTFIAGLHQINARVPAGIAAGPNVPLILTAGLSQSQLGVTLAVGEPSQGDLSATAAGGHIHAIARVRRGR